MAFKMKGHTLPGINQRMDKSSKADGRAKSSVFQDDKTYQHKKQEEHDSRKKARQKTKSRDRERGYTDQSERLRREKLRSYGFTKNEVKKEMDKWRARQTANTTYIKISKEDLLKAGRLSAE